MKASAQPFGRDGFTLVELVIVIMIIGILAGLTFTVYKHMIYKARMTQAQVVLKHLFRAEETVFSETGKFTDNLQIMDYDPVRFNYYTVSVVVDNQGKDFVGTATGVAQMAGDYWTITKEGVPVQSDNSTFK